MSSWAAPHRTAEQYDVLMPDSDVLSQVLIHNFRILLDLVLVRRAHFIQAVCWVLYCQYVHLHLLAHSIQQIVCEPYILSVPMKIDDDFLCSIIFREIETWDVEVIFNDLSCTTEGRRMNF